MILLKNGVSFSKCQESHPFGSDTAHECDGITADAVGILVSVWHQFKVMQAESTAGDLMFL